MKSILDNSRQFQSIWKGKTRKIALLSALAVTTIALATPPLGFIVNDILAKGVISSNISEEINIKKSPGGSDKPWGLELESHGATDFYVQHLVLAPGGYSGWHSHPGILIGTVTSGSIDFYDANCQKRTVNAGDVYFETGHTHGIVNTGSQNADLSISYLIKHNAPRRVEESAPACATSTPIP